jgi:alanine dehydrogenase
VTTPPPTLLLTRGDLARLIHPDLLARALRAGFASHTTSGLPPAQHARTDLPAPGTATVLFPGLIPDVPAFTIKAQTKFPDQHPAIIGVCCLHDLATGRLLAILDSSLLTAWRTGMSGALAADLLAPPGATRAAVIGAGAQGELQLRCLAHLRPLTSATVYDLDPARATAFAHRIHAQLGAAATPVATLDAATATAEILLVATWARQPFLTPSHLRAGMHITTLGADEPGKAEVAPDALTQALVVCDDRQLAVTAGALGNVGLGSQHIAAELGEILAGRHPGRTSPQQITVYAGIGLPFMDLAVAWPVYQAARQAGIGTPLDFLTDTNSSEERP